MVLSNIELVGVSNNPNQLEENSNLTSYYSPILMGDMNSLEDVIDWARGYDFSQECPIAQEVSNLDYRDTVNGVDILYNFGTDSYMFTDSER